MDISQYIFANVPQTILEYNIRLLIFAYFNIIQGKEIIY